MKRTKPETGIFSKPYRQNVSRQDRKGEERGDRKGRIIWGLFFAGFAAIFAFSAWSLYK